MYTKLQKTLLWVAAITGTLCVLCVLGLIVILILTIPTVLVG